VCLDHWAKAAVLAGTVRAQGHQAAARLQHRQGMGDVFDVRALRERRVHQYGVEQAQILDIAAALQKVGAPHGAGQAAAGQARRER
jgi:hypothetical protein